MLVGHCLCFSFFIIIVQLYLIFDVLYTYFLYVFTPILFPLNANILIKL